MRGLGLTVRGLGFRVWVFSGFGVSCLCFNGRFPPRIVHEISIFRSPRLNYGQVHARRNESERGPY